MTQPTTPQQPMPQQPPTGYVPQHMQQKGTSAMAVTALVLGIIGLILSWIPIVNNGAAVLAVIGLVFGVIATLTTGAKGKKKGRGLAIAGSILCVIALIITLAVQSAASKAIKDITDPTSSSQTDSDKSGAADKSDTSNQQVTLQATATGKGTVIWGEAGSSNTADFNGQWSKTISGEDAKKGYTISVTGDITGTDDQKVSCTVTVNGKQKSHKEGSGTSGAAMCDTYGIFN